MCSSRAGDQPFGLVQDQRPAYTFSRTRNFLQLATGISILAPFWDSVVVILESLNFAPHESNVGKKWTCETLFSSAVSTFCFIYSSCQYCRPPMNCVGYLPVVKNLGLTVAYQAMSLCSPDYLSLFIFVLNADQPIKLFSSGVHLHCRGRQFRRTVVYVTAKLVTYLAYCQKYKFHNF